MGGRRKRVHPAFLLTVPVPIPSLVEQRRIVDLLAAVDEAIEAAKQEVSRAREIYNGCLFDAMLHARERGPLSSLGDLSISRLGKMLSGASKSGSDERPYVRNANVQWDRVLLDDLATMNFSPAEEKEFELKAGEVLVCEGGQVGRAAVVANDLQGVFFQKAIHRVRCGDRLLPRFLMHYLRFCADHGHLADLVTAQTIAHLTGEKLRRLQVPTPEISYQSQVVSTLDSAAAVLRQAELLTHATQSLRSVVLADLLSGEHEIPGSYDQLLTA